MIKSSMRIKTPSKAAMQQNRSAHTGKHSPAFSRHTPIPTPNKQVFVKSPMGSRSPISKSFYREEGVRTPISKPKQGYNDILTIEELLDINYQCPPSYMASALNSRLNSAMATPSKNYADDLNFIYERGPYVSKRYNPEKGLFPEFEELTEGLRKGLINWDQLNFSRESLNYLQRNIHLLDR